ncbi:MAG: hypothetical protein WCD76_16180, partial [Pyrinomonadaceae bacterium]
RYASYSPVTTSKVRVVVNGALASHSRITEVEAYTEGAAEGASGVQGSVARIILERRKLSSAFPQEAIPNRLSTNFASPCALLPVNLLT